MENVLSFLGKIIFPAAEKEEEAPLLSVEEELVLLKKKIDAAQSRFDVSSSDAVTEAAIYDLNALEVRYRMLTRILKERGNG